MFTKLSILPLFLGLTLTATAETVMSGRMTGVKEGEVMAGTNFNGEVSFRQFHDIHIDSLGNYTIDIDMPVSSTELTIFQAQSKNLTFHIAKGLTVNADIDYTPATPDVKLSGPLSDINRACYAWDATQMDARATTFEEYAEFLRTSFASRVEPTIAAISDPEQRDYMSRLLKLKLQGRLLNLYQGSCRRDSIDPRSIPEYVAIYQGWNPNDPIMIDAGLIIEYVEARCDNPYVHREVAPIDFERLDIIGHDITNPECRRVALSFYGNMFFEHKAPSVSEANDYYNRFMPLTEGCAPEVAARAKKSFDTLMANVPGKPLNYNPAIETPDGKTLRLSDILNKVTYIDVWATWCGPCCAEIPHLEKVVEQYAGNEALQFASLSVDQDRDAWLRKLEKDKPSWPQYRVLNDEVDPFLNAHGVSGIPRFFLMRADGTFHSSNAPRPSDNKLHEIITSSLNP